MYVVACGAKGCKNTVWMILLKRIIGNGHFSSPLKLKYLPQNNSLLFSSSNFSNSNSPFFSSSISWGPFSLSTQYVSTKSGNSVEKSLGNDKASRVFFKEDVRLSEKIEFLEIEFERVCEETHGVNEELGNLEEEVTSLCNGRHENESSVSSAAKRNLWDLFRDKKKMYLGNKNQIVHKELSSDMQMLAYHLYLKGYFDGANLMPENRFDSTCFRVGYSREFLKFAAVEFGKDHQEIAKWLSAGDLKSIALFGCPSFGYKSVNAAKNLRRFFEIEEHEVCQKCRMKQWCKRADERAWNGATKLSLPDVIRVLVLYAMESLPQQLAIPKEIKDSVSRLLKEIINLSKTVTRSFPRTPL
ncbi:uncharacterized protein [Henckelia pumila]|uniref:uncharacterized protein n=1 Tax=Henckelia pumila TaxID=405737 RepID=UPI003C6E65DF